MSHFTVLVIEQPGKTLEEQLAPFHEFECTGLDEYIQELDKTEELRAEYAKSTKAMMRGPGKELVDRFDARFYREPTAEEQKKIGPIAGTGFSKGLSFDSRDWGDGKGYRTLVHFTPEGWEEVEVPMIETMTFLKFVSEWQGKNVVPFGQEPDLAEDHKFGYVIVDEAGEVVKVIDRTNPNAKWDWYQVGGHWSGMLRLKPGGKGAKGKRSLLDTDPDTRTADQADIVRKQDIDWESMRVECETDVRETYRRLHELLAPYPAIRSWTDVHVGMFKEAGLEDEGVLTEPGFALIEQARKVYHDQPGIKFLNTVKDDSISSLMWGGLETFLAPDIEAVVKIERAKVGLTHAILFDGQWYEHGEMGMWAVVHNEKDQTEWHDEFWSIMDKVPDDRIVMVVDCHI